MRQPNEKLCFLQFYIVLAVYFQILPFSTLMQFVWVSKPFWGPVRGRSLGIAVSLKAERAQRTNNKEGSYDKLHKVLFAYAIFTDMGVGYFQSTDRLKYFI